MVGVVDTNLILLKMLSKSFFISTRVRVWSRKRSFICCRRTLDSPLKLISISLVFSKRSSLFSQQLTRETEILISDTNETTPNSRPSLYFMAPLGPVWYSHVSLSLDDGVNILRVDHAQHPIAEHVRCRVLHHDDEQAEKTAIGNIYS